MKKITAIILIAALTVILAACSGIASEAGDYSGYIPENAEQVRTERDDGFTETTYRTPDNAEYEILTDSSNAVRVLKFDSRQKSTASEITLTADDAFAVITAIYPNAYLIHSNTDRDDGAYEWDVIFSDDEIIAEYELDAATGAIIDYTVFYGAPFGFDPVSIINSNYPAAEITEMSLDTDDGNLQIDGQARLENRPYDFTIDLDSQKIIEWEYDD